MENSSSSPSSSTTIPLTEKLAKALREYIYREFSFPSEWSPKDSDRLARRIYDAFEEEDLECYDVQEESAYRRGMMVETHRWELGRKDEALRKKDGYLLELKGEANALRLRVAELESQAKELMEGCISECRQSRKPVKLSMVASRTKVKSHVASASNSVVARTRSPLPSLPSNDPEDPRFPLEIMGFIVEHADTETLQALCLVSLALLDFSSKRLYSDIHLDGEKSLKLLCKPNITKLPSPRIAPFLSLYRIQTLVLDSEGYHPASVYRNPQKDLMPNLVGRRTSNDRLRLFKLVVRLTGVRKYRQFGHIFNVVDPEHLVLVSEAGWTTVACAGTGWTRLETATFVQVEPAVSGDEWDATLKRVTIVADDFDTLEGYGFDSIQDFPNSEIHYRLVHHGNVANMSTLHELLDASDKEAGVNVEDSRFVTMLGDRVVRDGVKHFEHEQYIKSWMSYGDWSIEAYIRDKEERLRLEDGRDGTR